MKKNDSMVEEVVNTIAEAVRPDKIILFGSRAQGKAREDSDIDVVVVCEGSRSKREIELHIRRLFRHPRFSMDIFVLTPEELERQKHVANTLAREVSERGIVCYG